MRFYPSSLCVVLLLCTTLPTVASSKVGVVDVPGAEDTEPDGINNVGHIAGHYINPDFSGGGFIRTGRGQFVRLLPANGLSVTPTRINRSDQTTGYVGGARNRIFIGAPDGSWATFVVPNATSNGTDPLSTAIDDLGNIIGYFGPTEHPSAASGFLRDSSGNFTVFDAPGAGTFTNSGTFPRAFGRGGKIYGDVWDWSGAYHGFIRLSKTGKIKLIDLPEAGTGNGQGTRIYCASPNDMIGGIYYDSNNVQHGFIRAPGGPTVTIDITGGTRTTVLGVNSLGEASGSYTDTNTGTSHAFLRDSVGTITTVDAPGTSSGSGQGTFPKGMNSKAQIVGSFVGYLNGNAYTGGFFTKRP